MLKSKSHGKQGPLEKVGSLENRAHKHPMQKATMGRWVKRCMRPFLSVYREAYRRGCRPDLIVGICETDQQALLLHGKESYVTLSKSKSYAKQDFRKACEKRRGTLHKAWPVTPQTPIGNKHSPNQTSLDIYSHPGVDRIPGFSKIQEVILQTHR